MSATVAVLMWIVASVLLVAVWAGRAPPKTPEEQAHDDLEQMEAIRPRARTTDFG